MSRRTEIDVRPITEAEFPDWNRALNTGFLRPPAVAEEQLEARRNEFVPGRSLGAFDGDRCVATFRSFDQELTAVGGGLVRADAVSNVTVTATHRRRGLLTRMMAQDLAAAKERGDVVATLIAAEYRIYGRYGFGPATSMTEWAVDVPRAGLDPRWAAPEDGGRIDLVDGADVRRLGPELHERLRRAQPGAVSRTELWWRYRTGVIDWNGSPWTEPCYALYRSADGEVEGMASYRTDDRWGDAKQPLNTATVDWLLAVTPAAERALWHYLCSIDWVQTVKSGWRSPTICSRISCRTRARPASPRRPTGCGCGSWTSRGRWRRGRTRGRDRWSSRSSTGEGSPAGGGGWRRGRTGRPARRPPRAPTSCWTWATWPRCGWATSRRCGWPRSAGCGKNERAPPVWSTPCCVRPGGLGARTCSEVTPFLR